MDPLTHAISGAALARAFPKQPLPAKQLFLIILLAMAPDSDIVLRLIWRNNRKSELKQTAAPFNWLSCK